MKATFKITVLLALVLFSTKSYSRINEDGQPIFNIIVKMPGGQQSNGDTITFAFKKPYYPKGTNNEVVRCVTDKNGGCEIRLPKFDVPVSVSMSIRHRGLYSRVYGEWGELDYFVFEIGDRITSKILLNNKGSFDSISFSGDGFEKYNTIVRLVQLKEDYRKEFNKIWLSKADNDTLLTYSLLIDKTAKKKASIIKTSGLKPTMQKIIAYETFDPYYEWIRDVQLYSTPKNSINPTLFRRYFAENKDKYHVTYDPIIKLCSNYLQKLATIENCYLKMNSPTQKVDEKDMYEVLKSYPDPVKELLIANFFLGGRGMSSDMDPLILDSLMKDSKKYIKNPGTMEIYEKRLGLFRGEPVFNGMFKDLYENDVSIASLKGKVVLIDIWSWGCGACVLFYKEFHKTFYPVLKNNKNFVYLSISGDKTKATYERSLESGKYTSNEYLNAYAKNTGVSNPFFKYYDIASLPFILLVDKNGNIYSQRISTPKEAFNLINEILREPIK